MSFDTSQLSGMNGDAKQIIFAHKSRIGRLEERLAAVEGERDRARGTGVALEQEIAFVGDRIAETLQIYTERWEQDKTAANFEALSAVQIIQHLYALATDPTLTDSCTRETQ